MDSVENVDKLTGVEVEGQTILPFYHALEDPGRVDAQTHRQIVRESGSRDS